MGARGVILAAFLAAGLPSIASAQTPAIDKVYGWGLVANAVAHAYDTGETVDCSVRRTCIEKNPYLAPFQQNPGALAAVKMAAAGTKTYLIHRYVWKKGRKKLAITMIAIDTVITSIIAKRNDRF